MAELDGEIVYQSGRTEVGESFCEDTALVRAYDKAVKPLQSVPAVEREGCHTHVNVPGESEGENETKREEEEDKGTKVQGLQQVRAEAEKNCAKIKQAQLNTNKKLRKNLS
ncbi:UNVERIFIED_CONTAM: hypothetical protein FKN15_038920 [Acipenser sinensis]